MGDFKLDFVGLVAVLGAFSCFPSMVVAEDNDTPPCPGFLSTGYRVDSSCWLGRG